MIQLKELEKLKLLREKEIKEIKNETKIKLNLLNYDINDTLKDLEFDLKYGSLKNRFFKSQSVYENETKLRVKVEEKINEIERLKGEVMNNEDRLLTMEIKIFKSLTDSKHEEERILHNLTTSELRLKN